jgi:hypothetical protein
MPEDVMTTEELTQLRELLGKWVSHVQSVNRQHVLVNAAELTYAFVNATVQHQGAIDTARIDPNKEPNKED